MGVAHVLRIEVEHHIGDLLAIGVCRVDPILCTILGLCSLLQGELDRNVLKVRLECRGVPVLGDAGLHRTRQAVGQCTLVVQIGVP